MLIYGHDKEVAAWAAGRLGLSNYEPCTAIGVEKDGFIVGAALFNNYHPELSIEISLVCLDKRQFTRQNIKKILAYPFIQLRVKRVQATCSKRNKIVRSFLERTGFRLEGISRLGWREGGDAAVYSLIKPDWENHELFKP